MSALSEILANEGAPLSFEWRGRTFTLRYLTQRLKAEFEQSLYKRARVKERINKDVEGLSDAEYAKNLKRIDDLFEAGEYGFISDRGVAHVKTRAGMLYLSSLICNCGEDELLTILGEMKEEVTSLVDRVLRDSIPRKKEGDQRPNEGAPA
jgi:hypothetical protein